MLFIATLHALLTPAFAAPAPGQDFEEWLRQAAEAEGLRILRWGTADLDRDGEADDAMAELCDLRPRAPGAGTPWRLYEADGQRWVVEKDHSSCKPGDAPPFRPLAPNEVAVDLGDHKFRSLVFLEAVDGHLEVTRSEWADLAGWEPGSGTTDWLRRVEGGSWTEYRGGTRLLPSGEIGYVNEVVRPTAEGAIIIVSHDLADRPVLNRVLSGADTHDGREDASFSVIAVEPSFDHLEIVVRLTDDVRTPRDRLELWWTGRGRPQKETLRSLVITWPDPDEDAPVAAWCLGGAPVDPLPVVSQGVDGAVTVRFTHGRFTDQVPGPLRGLESWATGFTVLFVDADDPTERPTYIATSDFDSQVPSTLGSIVRFPDHHPFPTHTRRTRERLDIAGIRELDPGQAHIRSAR